MPNISDTEEILLLRGVVRVENVEHPAQYIDAVLAKTKPKHIERTYDVRGYENSTEFLETLARKSGRLLKGGEADIDGVAKMVLNDFIRGKVLLSPLLPYLPGSTIALIWTADPMVHTTTHEGRSGGKRHRRSGRKIGRDGQETETGG